MELVSIVTLAVKSNKKFLLTLKSGVCDKGLAWGFPCQKFEEGLNGNLDDTINRILKNIMNTDKRRKHPKVEYLGSHIRKDQDKILVGYNFLIKDFNGKINAKNYKWVGKEEIGHDETKSGEIDKNTLIFLETNKKFL